MHTLLANAVLVHSLEERYSNGYLSPVVVLNVWLSKKARGSDLCMQLSTQLSTKFRDSTKKGRALFLIPPHVSSGFPHFRPQGPLPNSSHHRLGGLVFEHCGTYGYHTHPDTPEGGPFSRTKGRCEGVGTEGKKWALTSMILKL